MANQIFTNGASCRLGAPITTTSAIANITLQVGFGVRFPQPTAGNWFVVTLVKADYSAIECVRCSGRSGDVLTVETRAFDGTTANTWSTSDLVVLSPNAGAFADFRADLNALDTRLDTAEVDINALEVDVAALSALMAQRPRMDVGTRTVFHQAAAPTGWTLDTSVNDRVLRVSDTTGAVNGGSWTISGISVNGHALTIDQLPAHTHSDNFMQSTTPYFSGGSFQGYNIGPAGTTTTGSAGGGEAHSHGLTIGNSWRPAYTDVIICTRAAG